MSRRALILGVVLTSCGDRPYAELARALRPPVEELCSLQRKDSEAVGSSKTASLWRSADDARTLKHAARLLLEIPPFKGGEPTKQLVTKMQEQASVLAVAYQICGPPAANRTGEPPPHERACAERRSAAEMLKAEAELEDLLTKIARSGDHPDVEFPDPARCAK